MSKTDLYPSLLYRPGGGGSDADAVTASDNIIDNGLVRGDGGGKGIQGPSDSSPLLNDSGQILLVNGSANAPALAFSGVTNTGLVKFGTSVQLVWLATMLQRWSATDVQFSVPVAPNSDGAVNLGTAALRWGIAHFNGRATGYETWSGAAKTISAAVEKSIYTGTDASTATLPEAPSDGTLVCLSHMGTGGTVTIAAGSGDTINAQATSSLTSGQKVALMYNTAGSQWLEVA